MGGVPLTAAGLGAMRLLVGEHGKGIVTRMTLFVVVTVGHVCYQCDDRGHGVSLDVRCVQVMNACDVCVARRQTVPDGPDDPDVRSRVYHLLVVRICPHEDCVTFLTSASLPAPGRLCGVFCPDTCRGRATQRGNAVEQYGDVMPLSQPLLVE